LNPKIWGRSFKLYTVVSDVLTTTEYLGSQDIFRTTNQDVEEIEIDLDVLDTATLRELERYVHSLATV